MTEDEMVGWHHRLDGHGFGYRTLNQALRENAKMQKYWRFLEGVSSQCSLSLHFTSL